MINKKCKAFRLKNTAARERAGERRKMKNGKRTEKLYMKFLEICLVKLNLYFSVAHQLGIKNERAALRQRGSFIFYTNFILTKLVSDNVTATIAVINPGSLLRISAAASADSITAIASADVVTAIDAATGFAAILASGVASFITKFTIRFAATRSVSDVSPTILTRVTNLISVFAPRFSAIFTILSDHGVRADKKYSECESYNS